VPLQQCASPRRIHGNGVRTARFLPITEDELRDFHKLTLALAMIGTIPAWRLVGELE
jgi:hypothetical protein